MESANPYQAPSAELNRAVEAGEMDDSSVFSAKGRFGRLSYLAWAALVALVNSAFSAIPMIFIDTPDSPMYMAANILVIVVALALLVFGVIFGIRRLHDINLSGWWLLLMLVPVVNLIFALVMVFKAGSEEANDFGPPRFTPGWEKIVGAIFPIIMLAGVIAAIALPAYQGYIEAARQASGG